MNAEQEHAPLLNVQIELAEISDEVSLLILNMKGSADISLVTQVLTRIHGRLSQLSTDLFEIDVHLVDSRQLCMALDRQETEGGDPCET
ncbi:MAG: hypothetical protein QM599_03445 [Pseudoxanthomonas sp.]